jgi:hypothetical protein
VSKSVFRSILHDDFKYLSFARKRTDVCDYCHNVMFTMRTATRTPENDAAVLAEMAKLNARSLRCRPLMY